MWPRRRAFALLVFVALSAPSLFFLTPSFADQVTSPDAALTRLLASARTASTVPGTCAQPGVDRLIHILCEGRIRVGVREDYPLFGTRDGQVRKGYDVDVATAFARTLGVEVAFT